MKMELKIILLLGIMCIILSASSVNLAQKTNGNDIALIKNIDKITDGDNIPSPGCHNQLNNGPSNLGTGNHVGAVNGHVDNTKDRHSVW